MASRINLSLDPEYAEKLSRLAERMHVDEGTLAKSLLSTALDGVDPAAAHIVQLLDGTLAPPSAPEKASRTPGAAKASRSTTSRSRCRAPSARRAPSPTSAY